VVVVVVVGVVVIDLVQSRSIWQRVWSVTNEPPSTDGLEGVPGESALGRWFTVDD
jgi:hypothetical protein